MNIKLIRYLVLFGLCASYMSQAEELGGWAISQHVVDWIRAKLPQGSVILECGSGYGSGILSLYYEVHSIEHDRRWLKKYRGPQYIYAPIKNRWYDRSVLMRELSDLSYNLILVDGPPAVIGRRGFLDNLDLFKTDGVIIVFDDINRKAEMELMLSVAKKLNRTPMTLASDKTVGVLLP